MVTSVTIVDGEKESYKSEISLSSIVPKQPAVRTSIRVRIFPYLKEFMILV